ncbi:MAG: DUF1622 domain-containing protein, partial [Methanomicrobiales archaeon]|nr:DUF1622 domain-containing protein [Methanomicrobiales archaeon]
MLAEAVIQYAAMFFGYVGAAITIYGGIEAAVRMGQREILRQPITYTDIRIGFTNKIVFGLEFFIASDILTTLIAPTQDELILLGSVVVIRILL